MKKQFSISSQDAGVSLRQFIKSKLEGFSGKKVEALLAKNGCRINQAVERFGSRKLQYLDEVEIYPSFICEDKEVKIKILFEDDFLLIIDKPAFVPSCIKTLQKRLGQTLFLVHRLDKQTSGVLILVKTLQAKEAMESLFFKREIQKHYVAICHHRMSQRKGEIKAPLKLKKRYEGGVIYQTTSFGKEAVTHWEKAFSSKNETLFMLKPITGRTHQLRVHLSSIGHPILGDPIYKSEAKSSLSSQRMMLHARKICFTHPMTHKSIEIIAPIPIIMRQTISKLFKNQRKCAY